MITRRALVGSLGAGAGGLLLGGCDRIGASPAMRGFFEGSERLSHLAGRLTRFGEGLAPEYVRSDISRPFRANGTLSPAAPEYLALAANGFRDWRLQLDGLVRRPLSLSLADLMRLPARTQITRHDCVEGWSAIGQWTGTPLGGLLKAAGPLPAARFLVFHCLDDYGPGKYYESIDLAEGYHPQTILAWALNGERLPVANGAPLRLRVERQLGYKHAKYLGRVEAVASLAPFGRGKGGYWEDSGDYAWYAGI